MLTSDDDRLNSQGPKAKIFPVDLYKQAARKQDRAGEFLAPPDDISACLSLSGASPCRVIPSSTHLPVPLRNAHPVFLTAVVLMPRRAAQRPSVSQEVRTSARRPPTMADAAGNGHGLPRLRPAAREVRTVTTCILCIAAVISKVEMGAAADACGACGVLQAAEPALDGGDPNAPRGSPTRRFVHALLRNDPADVEHVDANPPRGGPTVVEVQEQRNILKEVGGWAGTVVKTAVVFGTVYAAFQVAAPAFVRAIKRQACPPAYILRLCALRSA